MKIYDRIRIRREALDMSQDELARKLGYKSRTTIAKIEAGINDITQSKVMAFAKALDCTPSYLMGWEEPVLPETKEEDEVIKLYDSLNNSDKEFIKSLVKKLAGVDKSGNGEGN